MFLFLALINHFIFQYVCLICNLFDLEDRKQFHCEDCGMCRVGGRENYHHCKTCDMCLPVKLKNTHKVNLNWSCNSYLYFPIIQKDYKRSSVGLRVV